MNLFTRITSRKENGQVKIKLAERKRVTEYLTFQHKNEIQALQKEHDAEIRTKTEEVIQRYEYRLTRAQEEVARAQKELQGLVKQYKSFLVLKDELEMIRGDIQPLLRKFQELLKITDTIDKVEYLYRRKNKEKII